MLDKFSLLSGVRVVPRDATNSNEACRAIASHHAYTATSSVKTSLIRDDLEPGAAKTVVGVMRGTSLPVALDSKTAYKTTRADLGQFFIDRITDDQYLGQTVMVANK